MGAGQPFRAETDETVNLLSFLVLPIASHTSMLTSAQHKWEPPIAPSQHWKMKSIITGVTKCLTKSTTQMKSRNRKIWAERKSHRIEVFWRNSSLSAAFIPHPTSLGTGRLHNCSTVFWTPPHKQVTKKATAVKIMPTLTGKGWNRLIDSIPNM